MAGKRLIDRRAALRERDQAARDLRVDAIRREAVLAAWAGGASYGQIGPALGLSRSAVNGIIYRAREAGDTRAAKRLRLAVKPQRPAPQPKVPALMAPALKAPRAIAAKAVATEPPRPRVAFAAGKTGHGVPLLETRPGTCRWPVGQDERGVLFCDAPRDPAARLSWCAAHHAIGCRGVAAPLTRLPAPAGVRPGRAA